MKRIPLSSKSVESDLFRRGFRYVLGSDESGTGSIAGPVVVATCCLIKEEENVNVMLGVQDSKTLTAEERTRIYHHVTTHPDTYAWNYHIATPMDIEQSNTIKATMQAFQNSIQRLVEDCDLPPNQTYSIVDGHRTPMLHVPIKCRPWKHADAQVYTVAVASILAKVTLDAIMMDLHDKYPMYDFHTNKGYPTRQHVQHIHTYGITPCHRIQAKPTQGRKQ